jgi:hypothetical protein
MKMRILTPLFIIMIAIAIGCAGSVTRKAAPVKHPEELTGREADCLECHDNDLTGTLKPYGTFRHSNSFLIRHGTYALQGQDLCNSCHGDSFCMECHPTKGGLMPSIRRGDRPDRDLMPHRGDYIVQHQIDGRVDPGSCVRCHGNRNDSACLRCHR